MTQLPTFQKHQPARAAPPNMEAEVRGKRIPLCF